jgi:hypothetical protein
MLRILLPVVTNSSDVLVLIALWAGYIPHIVGFTTQVVDGWSYFPTNDFVIV